MLRPVILFTISLCLFSCKNEDLDSIEPSLVQDLDSSLNYNDLVDQMNEEVVALFVEEPDDSGAMGRNRNGYFHVRFQVGMTKVSDYAVKFNSEEALSAYLKNLNYSFSHQTEEGDFEYVIPDNLQQTNGYQPPSENDLASGVAFFAYSLGISLNSLIQSDWFNNSGGLQSARETLNGYDNSISDVLGYLKRSKRLLLDVDQKAPNRLLFNAIAFYSLGSYVGDKEAQEIGLDFARLALSQVDSLEGYFIEGGGWDSSYNGVATMLSFELFTLLAQNNQLEELPSLGQIIARAAYWQSTRVLNSGEISTEGNTRVYPGGEEFLGNEKGVDVLKTVKSFFYMSILSGDDTYQKLARRVIEFYD